jgi:hypothetical protein
VRAARLAELKREALASAELAAYWEDHPADRDLLAHERPLDVKAKRARSAHLAEVPSYLLPPTLRAALEAAGAGIGTSKIGAKKKKKRKDRKQLAAQRGSGVSGGAPPPGTAAAAPPPPPALPPLRTATALKMAAEDAYRAGNASALRGAVEARGGGAGHRLTGTVDPLRAFTVNRNKAARVGL